MADKELKPQGLVDPTKKPTWLKEVKVDAARNTIEHMRRQKEAQEFAQLKARGVTPEEIIEKGKEDLSTPEAAPVSRKESVGSEDVAKLKAELKAERAARTRAENKLAAQSEDSSENTAGDGKKVEVK